VWLRDASALPYRFHAGGLCHFVYGVASRDLNFSHFPQCRRAGAKYFLCSFRNTGRGFLTGVKMFLPRNTCFGRIRRVDTKLEELVPESLALGSFAGLALPFLGKGNGPVANLIP